MNFPGLTIGASLLLALTFSMAHANEVEHHNAIRFAQPGGVDLLLNLHMPKGVGNPPLVMFIHGGGWMIGNRTWCPLQWVTEHGYAVASIEYRLSKDARFPAQIQDCKGALRWLRAHRQEYGYDSSKVVVAGASAGGYLAALMGASGGVAGLEGETAGHPDQSSGVQGVIDYFGPIDFVKRSEDQPSATDDPKGSVYQLLGGPVKANLEAARAASPTTYLSPDDPSFLILHGDKDKTVHLNQSKLLYQRCKDLGIDAQLHIEPGGGHGFKTSEQEKALVLDFLEKVLRRSAVNPPGDQAPDE